MPDNGDCQAFLRELRRDSVNSGLDTGQLGTPVVVPDHVFSCLWREVLGRDGTVNGWCVWQRDGSEVALHVVESRTALREGLVLAALRLMCDQEPRAGELVVPLATGSEAEPAGLLTAAETRARGKPLLVEAWGETAVAVCFAAMMEIAATVAAATGTDRAGRPLLPGAVRAEHDEFMVFPQAAHSIDRWWR
ncbi:hypothetical protein OIE13_13540 [Streptosporangium sp. NBC_01810]|uniref:hypothetical protein n=1 Tax=Streptosporangium sp. NBC_01810 TaxID=2975951 RepID=UPI002DD900B8|nr:hypothetical protein [Streptosporangium sp. NBC_01810]WSA28804.1 hypothetical protein OIE13_13540 [Streptosporangium sp. NBC_01810]